MKIDYNLTGNILSVKVEFSEDSNTNKKIDTSIVVEKVIEKGYKPAKFSSVDAVVDTGGEKNIGEWEFLLEKEANSDEKEYLKGVKGIGEKTSEKLLKKFEDLATLQKRMMEGDIENFSGMSEEAENRLRKYILGKDE